jgi:N-acetylmuramoyl-L-alanine amidase
MRCPQGVRIVSIRATHLKLAAVCGALLAGFGVAGATERMAARPAMPESFPVASDVRVGGDDNQTRFVLDLSRKIELRAFTLADPYRVVVDIPQVSFQLPPKTGEQGRGLIKAFRFGLVMQGGSRIVLDVKRPVRIDKAFMLDAADGQPARLVLDLAGTDRETFMRGLALDRAGPARPPRSRPKSRWQSRTAIRARSSSLIRAMAASTMAPRLRAV